MRLRLAELQKLDKEVQKIRAIAELAEGWEDINRVFYHQGLPFILEIIWIELISRHYKNPLIEQFSINKTRELISRKYYWASLRKDVKGYIKGCNVCLALKTVRHKPYSGLQALPVSTHQWKNFLIDFVTGLPVSTDWKGESYNSILVIVNRLTKMVH